MKSVLILLIIMGNLLSCNTGPEQINTGIDQCYFCKMTISDARFGAEVITKKGKIYKFDDSQCLLDFLKAGELPPAGVKEIYLSNFCEVHQLLNVKQAVFLRSNNLRGPMGGNIAAFNQADSLRKIQSHYNGINIRWGEIYKQ